MFDKAKFEAGLKKDFNVIAKKVVDKTLDLTIDELMFRSAVGQPDEWESKKPKNYIAGEYKANWLHSIGTPVFNEMKDARDDSFQQKDCETGRRLKADVRESKLLYTTHHFTNSSNHAIDVEHGKAIHNPQSITNIPYAVAGLTADTVPELLRQAKQEVLK